MPGIDYTLGMKTAGFDSGVGGALGKLAALGAKVAAVTAAAGLAVGAGLGAIVAKSIEKAANMETLEASFAPLLNGAAAAKARIAELSKFAAVTPFELPEIASASRVLETLTRGALSTGRGLTLVGDIASATNQPFDEIAVSIGRLYDGLDSGRPVGEAAQRLQELGVLSGTARGQIEDLQKEGRKGAEVWGIAEAAMSRFSGSMERQSGTWTGLMSTLNDTISMTMAQFGKPIMDSLKPYLTGLTAQIEGMQSIATRVGEKIASVFDITMAAFQTGDVAGLLGDGLVLAAIDGVNAFSSGIRGTMAFLQSALKQIMGDVRESWGLSELLGVFADLAKGVGSMITAAILEAMTHIPFLTDNKIGELQDAADSAEKSSGNSFNRAGNRVADFDGGAAIQDLFKSAVKAWDEGKEAFKKAVSEPLIDREAAAARLDERLGPINAKIAANKAAAAKISADMDAKLSNRPASNSATAAAAAVNAGNNRPTADRLAQIGGYVGGSRAALSIAERTAKFTEKTASGIDKLIAYTLLPAGQPGAVF